MIRFNYKWRLFVLSLLIFHLRSSPTLLATDSNEEHVNPAARRIPMREQEACQNSFGGLPNEIVIHHIVPSLQAPDIFALRQSCKGLYGTMEGNNTVWKRLYICLKAKGSLDFEDAVSNWKIFYQATSKLQQQIRELSFTFEPTMPLIESALLTNHPFASYIKGIHAEMQAKEDEGNGIKNNNHTALALEYYQKASDGGCSAAHERLISAIYRGELGFKTRPIEERRAMLEQKASEGDGFAQTLIDLAHFSLSPLKYHEKPQANYFETLKIRTQKRDNDAVQARRCLAQAIVLGISEYAGVSESERCQLLQNFEKRGETEARYWINCSLYAGTLGYGQLIKQERFNILSKRASENDEVARSFFYKALYEGTLEQNTVPKKERFEKLLDEADKGQRVAQEYVSQAYYDGGLSQQSVSKKKRFEALLKREQQGDRSAQTYITHAYYYGALDCDKLSNKQRLEILLLRATNGDRQAQFYICEVFAKGELGQPRSVVNAYSANYSFLLLNTLTGNRG